MVQPKGSSGQHGKGLYANSSHPFVEPTDGRSGLALGLGAGLQTASPLAVADASLRADHCGLSGCGKPRQDPIHEPVE